MKAGLLNLRCSESKAIIRINCQNSFIPRGHEDPKYTKDDIQALKPFVNLRVLVTSWFFIPAG